MPIPFIMPKVDMDQEKAVIISWLKKEGDLIKMDETVLTVETEKVAIDVPAPATGTLARILHKEGAEVPVTEVIAYILKEGETLADLPALEPSAAVKEEQTPAVSPPQGAQPQQVAPSIQATPLAVRAAKAQGVDLSQVAPAGKKITREDVERHAANQTTPSRVETPATPAARRVSRELGIPLEAVPGTGPGGRVQAADVASMNMPQAKQTAASGERRAEVVPLTSIRRTIAERMQLSFQEAPHIALTVEVDITELERTRKQLNTRLEKAGQPRVTITAFMIKFVAWALTRNPYLNASFNGDSILLWEDINIGIAAAAPQGLVVPVIKGADILGIQAISQKLNELAERARSNKLKLEDVQGGTFTISNLGMFGIRQFRAVINPPESGILAVGSVVRKPVVVDDHDLVAVRPIVSITLSADHRVVDGIVAAQFLNDLVAVIESPTLLLA